MAWISFQEILNDGFGQFGQGPLNTMQHGGKPFWMFPQPWFAERRWDLVHVC